LVSSFTFGIHERRQKPLVFSDVTVLNKGHPHTRATKKHRQMPNDMTKSQPKRELNIVVA